MGKQSAKATKPIQKISAAPRLEPAEILSKTGWQAHTMHGFVGDEVCEELGLTAHSTRCEATVAMQRGEQLTVARGQDQRPFLSRDRSRVGWQCPLRIVALTLPEFQKDVA